MSEFQIRPAAAGDRPAIRAVTEQAFGQPAEADLVDALFRDGDAVVELVAVEDGRIVGHVLFSRLTVLVDGGSFAAVALAPVSVAPDRQRAGIGGALIGEAHSLLRGQGERLSVVLGDPEYYARFGYGRPRAEAFDSDYQCAALQALAWGDAPDRGRLVYARAFGAL